MTMLPPTLHQPRPRAGKSRGGGGGGSMHLPTLIALIALLLAGAAALLLAAPVPPLAAQTITDYDSNDNGLIDISSLAQLHAMRWDQNGDGDPDSTTTAADYLLAFPDRDTATSTRMGCPSGTCTGYELTASLTFPAETSSPHNPWTPMRFAATFDGNGHTLTNLNIPAPSGFRPTGLFDTLSTANGLIKNVGLINPTVATANRNQVTGALVGWLEPNAKIETSYVAGGSVTGAGFAARVGGLVGLSQFDTDIRASYSTAAVGHVGNPDQIRVGGLLGYAAGGKITASYAAGPVTPGTGTSTYAGGLVGLSAGTETDYPDSYCDTQATMQTDCVGGHLSLPDFTPVDGYDTAYLQHTIGYCDIYEFWNLDLDGITGGDNPWNFGTETDYPTPWKPADRPTTTEPVVCAPPYSPTIDSPPPGGPRRAQPPQDTPYNPEADHPESYDNPRYDMSATCAPQPAANGQPAGVLITIDLGDYQGEVILHLSLWNGEYFASYESHGLTPPALERDGQTATVQITTDPAQTRFLMDSVSPTTNLVLGYADCHTDDPGAAAAAESPTESAETSTPPTPPAEKIYTNDRHEMTASCEVQHNADGDPESSLISFDLGNYEGAVILHLSLWNGEYYASFESHGLTQPLLERDGQTATVQVPTNPTETRFLLNSTSPTTNLLLGYADCHTAGQ